MDNLDIIVPFDSEKDVEGGRTSLSIDMEHGTLPNPAENGYGSKYLLLTCPLFSEALLETVPAAIQTTYDNDIMDYYENNNVGITKDDVIFARDTSIKNCNVALAQGMDEKTRKPVLETYRLKLPCDPTTGEQIYVHAYCWQGETWNSRHDGASGDLRGFPNIAPYEDNSPLSLESLPYTRIAGFLIFKVAMFGNEGKDLHHLISTPKTTPKKVINRLQVTMNAKAQQDQANALNRGGSMNPPNPPTSSTAHHHRNHATTASHHHSPPRAHTTRTHYTHQTGTQHQQNQSYSRQTGTQHQQNQSYTTHEQPFTQQEHTTTQQEHTTTQPDLLDPFNTYNNNEHTTTQHDQSYPYHDSSTYYTKRDGENRGGRKYTNDEDDEHLVSMASASQDDMKPPARSPFPSTRKYPWTDGREQQTDGTDDEYYDGYARRVNHTYGRQSDEEGGEYNGGYDPYGYYQG